MIKWLKKVFTNYRRYRYLTKHSDFECISKGYTMHLANEIEKVRPFWKRNRQKKIKYVEVKNFYKGMKQ